MKADLLLGSLLNMLLFSLIVEGAVSAIFSITAMKVIETKRAVQTSREAITFLVGAYAVFAIPQLQLMKTAGITFPLIGDIIISAMVLMRMTGFIRDILTRIRG